jgi:hypothetical protein
MVGLECQFASRFSEDETLGRWRPSGIGSEDMTDGLEAEIVTQIAGYLMVTEQRLMWDEAKWQTVLGTLQGRSIASIRQLYDQPFTAQWSLYVPNSGHYMYRTVVTICTAQRSLYVPNSGHYMYRTVVTICTVQWSVKIATI